MRVLQEMRPLGNSPPPFLEFLGTSSPPGGQIYYKDIRSPLGISPSLLNFCLKSQNTKNGFIK